ncbi:MAG: energy-coupling factor transporter transmembrane component T family protein, partial [Candidatus Asgardarchaeia archaeon]
MSYIIPFTYVKKNSLLHELDPRTKLITSLSVAIYCWLSLKLSYILLSLIPVVSMMFLSKLSREILSSMKGLMTLMIILFPLNLVIFSIYTPSHYSPLEEVPEDRILFMVDGIPIFGEFKVTRLGLETALAISMRLLILFILMSIVFMSTDLDEIEALLLKMHLPYKVIFMLIFTIRFIPVLSEEAVRIKEAQMARGLELRGGNFLKRFWNSTLPILIPTIVSGLRHSIRFAEALETRATFSRPERTFVVSIKMRKIDYVLS